MRPNSSDVVVSARRFPRFNELLISEMFVFGTTGELEEKSTLRVDVPVVFEEG
jgi:hypothetical protein